MNIHLESKEANDLRKGSIAQLAEQAAFNRLVAGSSPAAPTQFLGV